MAATHKSRVPAAYKGRAKSKETKTYAVFQPEEKAKMVAQWLEDKLGRDILALDLRGLSDVSDVVVFATAENSRHAQGLADHILEKTKEANVEFLRMEGYRHGHWILLDMNDLILHVFQPEDRNFFNLEGLWPKAPVLFESEPVIEESDEDMD